MAVSIKPSIDWIRRTSALTGNEDLLKQNPIGDVAPQEERIQTKLILDYILGNIDIYNNQLRYTNSSGNSILIGNVGDGTASGTVNSVAISAANGFNGSIANPTTTPTITISTTITGLLKGNGTAISAATAGVDYVIPSGTVANITGILNGFSFPALTGHVTTVAGTLATTIVNNIITNNKLVQVATATFKGRITAGTGNVEDLTVIQATSLLNIFTPTLKGLVPAPNTSTGKFLRDDGSWTALSGGGGGTVNSVAISAANGFDGSIANPTTTPTITISTTITGLLKGNGTAISAATAGVDYLVPNNSIIAGTKTKINYDTNGFVLSGTDATASDIINNPTGNISASTVQLAITQLDDIKQPKVGFYEEGILVGTSGQYNKINFIGANITATQDGSDTNKLNVTITGSASSTWSNYSAGNNVMVTASDTGVVATKTGSAWFITVPTNVILVSTNITILPSDVSTTPDESGASNWITVKFTGTASFVYDNNNNDRYFRVPSVTAHIIPIGVCLPTNAGSMNTSVTGLVGISTNNFTIRKSNLSTSNTTVLTFSGF